jgi:hypothetical protein
MERFSSAFMAFEVSDTRTGFTTKAFPYDLFLHVNDGAMSAITMRVLKAAGASWRSSGSDPQPSLRMTNQNTAIEMAR